MILQGVGHQISCLGVCYANDPPKRGGYTTPAPALDLTTSLRGDFHVPLNSLPSVKTAKSSLARGHMGGGGPTGGTWSWDLRPPPWVRGSIYKKKVLHNPGPNTHTAATIRKEVLTPLPAPPPPKKGGTQVLGGTGVKIQKITGGSFFILK